MQISSRYMENDHVPVFLPDICTGPAAYLFYKYFLYIVFFLF